MGLFHKIFGNEPCEDKPKINWIPLVSTSQLDEISTSQKLGVIFKHSTRCFTSKIVLNQFQNHFELDEGQVDMYFLDVLAHRSISNAIENRFGVYHESPQLIVIKNGKAVDDTSHSGILHLNIEQYL